MGVTKQAKTFSEYNRLIRCLPSPAAAAVPEKKLFPLFHAETMTTSLNCVCGECGTQDDDDDDGSRTSTVVESHKTLGDSLSSPTAMGAGCAPESRSMTWYRRQTDDDDDNQNLSLRHRGAATLPTTCTTLQKVLGPCVVVVIPSCLCCYVKANVCRFMIHQLCRSLGTALHCIPVYIRGLAESIARASVDVLKKMSKGSRSQSIACSDIVDGVYRPRAILHWRSMEIDLTMARQCMYL